MRLPDVILLNGPTSAGKTSIARALQARLPGPYLRQGIDDAIGWCGPEWTAGPEGFRLVAQADGRTPVVLGAGARAVLRGWRRMVAAGVGDGLKFIIDEVLLEPAQLAGWRAALADRDLLLVGVRCALEELQRRELARGDRAAGQALAQFDVVHDGVAYDLEVDTTRAPAQACAQAILAHLAR